MKKRLKDTGGLHIVMMSDLSLKSSFLTCGGKTMRKILKKNNKSKRINGTVKGKIRTPLNIMDKHMNNLSVGDEVKYGEYKGILLYNHHYDQYGIALDYSMWYGDNKYNIDSYGKFIDVPMDNGARMEIELINHVN